MESIGIGTAMLLVGIAWIGLFAFIHFRAAGKAKASETWPVAPGRILSSQVVIEESKDREGGSTIWYNPVVAYSYNAAGGGVLQGSRIRFANMRESSRAKAEAVLAPYPEGGAVSIRYNPEKPAESVLESQKPGPLYLVMAAFGLLFVIFGLLWTAMA